MNNDIYKITDPRPQVHLRKLTLSDALSVYEHVKDKAIVRYTLGIPHPYTLQDARQFINYSIQAYKKKSAYIFGIELKEKKGVIGIVSLSKIDRKNKNCELGYWLGKKYWNRGIMSNAVKMILEFAFKKLKMHRICAGSFASNSASLRVLEKNGFVREGILCEKFLRNNKWHNLFIYGQVKNNHLQKSLVDINKKNKYHKL